MAKPLLQLAALGVAGVVIWKLASFFLLPVLFFALKLALIAGAVVLLFWWLNKNDKKKDTPPVSE
jgi:hypothetical protein